jgi:hypothetical protein
VACGPNANDFTTATLQHLAALPLYALVRFARWDEIDAMPQPKGASVYPQAVWHWARGVAQARRGEPVARHFVALATYLGHAEIANTYWYLEATPELMTNLAQATETRFGGEDL